MPSVYETQQHLPGIGTKKTITDNRLGIRIVFVDLFFEETPGLLVCPSAQMRLRQTTKPDFVFITQNSIGAGEGETDQALTRILHATKCSPSRTNWCNLV